MTVGANQLGITDLVPSVSIQALVMKRDAMVERVTRAHQLLVEADQLAENLFGEAHRGHRLALRTAHTHREFTDPQGLEDLVKEIDSRAWGYLLQESGLRSFMDAAARAEWDRAIDKNEVPPLTADNIESTFRSLYGARGEMFERGVIAIFRSLSWDYKTNSPVAFGKRLILRHIVEVWGVGGWRYTSPHHDGTNRLDDLVRVLSMLDGKPEPDYRQGCYHRMSAAKWPKESNPIRLDYFTVRGFKNGNGHLVFHRLDLVEKMNRILAKHYPNALPPTREP